MIELILKSYEKGDETVYGELAFYDENKFSPINYIGNNNSLILSFELSNLGIIDILAKSDQKSISISIFLENEDILKALRENYEILDMQLEKALTSYEKSTISINLYNRREILKNLIEINSYYANNSKFDIKV